MSEEEPKPPRLIDAMPRPLGITFALAALVALVFAIIGILRPPTPPVALADRRPPPTGSFTHNVGAISPLPLPSVIPTLPPACDAVANTRIDAGGDGVLRIRKALEAVCTLSNGGVSSFLGAGVRGLEGATIRFGGFSRTGVESTADRHGRIIWLNARFAIKKVPEESLAPLIVHEGFHFGTTPIHPEGSALEELEARHAEVDACRALLDIRKWPRWCKDARDLTAMSQDDALTLLLNAGYEPPVGH